MKRELRIKFYILLRWRGEIILKFNQVYIYTKRMIVKTKWGGNIYLLKKNFSSNDPIT